MAAKAEIESPSEAETFAESVAELVSLSLVRAAEIVIAFAALWLIKASSPAAWRASARTSCSRPWTRG